MSRPRRIIALTGMVATAGFTSLAAATVAGATTSQCASNGFCYTQEVHGTNLVMSVGSSRGPYSNEQVVVQKQLILLNFAADLDAGGPVGAID